MVDVFSGIDTEWNESNTPAAGDPADQTAYEPGQNTRPVLHLGRHLHHRETCEDNTLNTSTSHTFSTQRKSWCGLKESAL